MIDRSRVPHEDWARITNAGEPRKKPIGKVHIIAGGVILAVLTVIAIIAAAIVGYFFVLPALTTTTTTTTTTTSTTTTSTTTTTTSTSTTTTTTSTTTTTFKPFYVCDKTIKKSATVTTECETHDRFGKVISDYKPTEMKGQITAEIIPSTVFDEYISNKVKVSDVICKYNITEISFQTRWDKSCIKPIGTEYTTEAQKITA